MFIDEQRNFTKDTNAYRSIRLALGNGLVTSEGDFWLRQRRIAQPAFRRRLARYLAVVTDGADATQEMAAETAGDVEPVDAVNLAMAVDHPFVGIVGHAAGSQMMGAKGVGSQRILNHIFGSRCAEQFFDDLAGAALRLTVEGTECEMQVRYGIAE